MIRRAIRVYGTVWDTSPESRSASRRWWRRLRQLRRTPMLAIERQGEGFTFRELGLIPDGLKKVTLRSGPLGGSRGADQGARARTARSPVMPIAQDRQIAVQLVNISAPAPRRGRRHSPAGEPPKRVSGRRRRRNTDALVPTLRGSRSGDPWLESAFACHAASAFLEQVPSVQPCEQWSRWAVREDQHTTVAAARILPNVTWLRGGTFLLRGVSGTQHA